MGNPLSILFNAGAHNSRGRLGFGGAAHDDVEKRNAALRPRPIKFDVVRFGQLLRTHVADYADNFRRQTVAVVGAEKNLVADRILVRKKFLRGRVAQDHDQRLINSIAFVEFPSGKQRNSERAEVAGRNTACESQRPLVDRNRISIGARVRRS